MNSKMNRSEILHQFFVTPSVRINYNNWKPKEAVGSFDAKMLRNIIKKCLFSRSAALNI